MLNKETPQLLVSSDTIEYVNNECGKLGFSNIRLFKTSEYKTKDDLCFVATSIEESENQFFQIEAQQLIAEKLKCKVTFITEDILECEFKTSVLKSAIAYTKENQSELKQFAKENLLANIDSSKKTKHEEESSAPYKNKKQVIQTVKPFWSTTDVLPKVEQKKTIAPEKLAGDILNILQQEHPDLLEQLQENIGIIPQVLTNLGNLIGKQPSTKPSLSLDNQ